jgi:hypothetical protein
VADEEVDVRALAGRQLPAEGAWLRVTAAGAWRGGGFTAVVLPGHRLLAGSGDVLVHVSPSPGWWTPEGTLVADVQVWAAVAGALLLVAGWTATSLNRWPENIRCPVVFAQGALRELRDHGADAGSPGQVDLAGRAGSVATAFPALPTRVNLGG